MILIMVPRAVANTAWAPPNSSASYPNVSRASSHSSGSPYSSPPSIDEGDSGPECRSSLQHEWSCKHCRKTPKRNNDASDNTGTGIGPGNIIAIVAMIGGFGLTGGIGSVGIQIAAAGLRLATMTAYAGATGAAAVGTGYIAIQGGRLVIQQSKPGVIMTVRAANRVSRDCRTGALAAGQAVVDAAGAVQSGVVSQAQTAVGASNQVRNQVLSGSEALMARLFNLPAQIPNILLRPTAQGQESLTIRVLSEEEAHTHLQESIDPDVETFVTQHLTDGTTTIQRVVRDGDLGNASWTVAETNQAPLDHGEENEDGFVEVQVQTSILSLDDYVSISDGLSFETARESPAIAVEDSDRDYDIV